MTYYQDLVTNVLLESGGAGILASIGQKANKAIMQRVVKNSGKLNAWLHKKTKENAAEDDIVYKGLKRASNIAKQGTKYIGKAHLLANQHPEAAGVATVAAGAYGSGKIGARLARRRDRQALRTYR